MKNRYDMTAEKIVGPLAPITTAFDDEGNVDIESTCAWIDWMIQNGITQFWTTYGTSHYFCMSDEEIMSLTKAIANTIGHRGLLIASTNFHWPVGKVLDFIEFANHCGVDVVKVQLDWRQSPKSEDVFNFCYTIAQQTPLPLFAYTLPQGMTYDLFGRILDIPQYIGMKNDAGDFYENCKYLAMAGSLGRPFRVMTGGTMSSFYHGSGFGAKAYADVMAMLNPKISLEFYECVCRGDLARAMDIMIKYENPYMKSVGFGSGAVNLKAILHGILYVKGLFKSPFMRFPISNIEGDLIEVLSRYHPIEELVKV